MLLRKIGLSVWWQPVIRTWKTRDRMIFITLGQLPSSAGYSGLRMELSDCLIQGIARFRLGEFTQIEPYLKAKIQLIPEVQETGLEIEALARNARNQFEHISELVPSIPRELVSSISSLEDPLQTVYTIANFQRMDPNESQEILELDSVSEKLHKLVGILAREGEVLGIRPKDPE